MAHPVGRPSPYKPEYCEIAKKLMKEGASKIEVAYELDVCRQTLDNWAKENVEFFNTINAGVDSSEGWWTKQGRHNLENKDFNSRLWEINMMNRFGWMKRAENKHEVTAKLKEEIKDNNQIRNEYEKTV